jgi:hypothetical protein
MSEYKDIRLDVPSWTREHGTPVEFDEEARVTARTDGRTTLIEANAAGMRCLARLLLTLAAADVPDGTHVHLDHFTGMMDGTSEVIVERSELI